MSNNYPEKNSERNEITDSFNLSKEELMNCFGSQIASQSSQSNCDYQNDYNSPEKGNKVSQENSQKSQKGINKDEILKNICHGIIDMFFSQKEELKGIKEEIKKLQNIMINNGGNNANGNNNANNINNVNSNNNGNNKPVNKKNKNNVSYNFNNSKKNNSFFNLYPSNNSNNISNNINNNNNSININTNNNHQIRNINKKHRSRSKSPGILVNPKSKIPETVPEVDEELELKSNQKSNRNDYPDPFLGENSDENQIKIEDIHDDEFDEVLLKGRNDKINKKIMMNDPFKKSSELKKRKDSEKNLDEDEKKSNEENSKEKNDIKNNNDSYIDIEDENEDINSKINDKNLGEINLDLDEMQSDFIAGGKKISVKLNDNLRKKLSSEMSSFDEPVNILEELSKNKKPSNINHINSKLSCSEVPMSKNKEINLKPMNNKGSKTIQINAKMKPSKRNYNTMMENSKKIIDKENMSKKNEERKNGSSVKERGGFMKKVKKFGNSNDYPNIIYNNNIKSHPSSNNNSQNTHKKTIKNKKYMFSTISHCEFYCLCQKQNYAENDSINLIENSKCKICKNYGVINIKNFQQGFYYYVLNDINNIKEIKRDNSIFLLLIKDIKELNEKDSDYSTKKDLEQFFNYQFIFEVYDKYIKISREKENNSESHIENLIEDIYSKLINKYIQVFVKAKRSFLTEISEGDSGLGYVNICLLLMNISNSSDPSNGDKIIEFSDGFKSCFATINQYDPINKLLDQMTLHNWMNVQIGMSKVLNITEDFKLFIKIYYNSISSYENNDTNNAINYGPFLEDNKKFLTKNINELRNDGGEISLINVIIMNKSNFYVNNITRKIRVSRRKYESNLMVFNESSEKKNYKLSESEEKNKMNNNEIKEPDSVFLHFKVIAMDFEIYNLIKKGENINNKTIEHLLKKKYVIEFCVRYQGIFDSIEVGRMYQLMFLNLENKNNSNANKNQKKYYAPNSNENTIYIRYNDKAQINEIPLNANHKTDKAYLTTNELINKNLILTNNVDIGKLFVECEEDQKPFNKQDFINKEVSLSGIYTGYVDKSPTQHSNENNNNNETNETNNEEEKIERYIFLSIGNSRIAIVKLHKEDFYDIDFNSIVMGDKIFYFTDVIFNEIIYFDDDNNQPKITGIKKMENSIPLLYFKTNCYTSITLGNYKNKEQNDMFNKYKEKNKKLVEMISEVIV